jgi:hypothetical protein
LTAEEKLRCEERAWLWEQPAFRRHLFEIYDAAGITRFTREEQHALFQEGKRSLGLEILGWFSAERPEPHDVIATVIEARMNFSKGAQRDRSDDPGTDGE